MRTNQSQRDVWQALTRWFESLHPFWQFVLRNFVGTGIVLAIISGIVWAVATLIAGDANIPVRAPLWALLAASAVGLLLLIYLWLSKRLAIAAMHDDFKAERSVITHLLSLDDTLFRLLSQVIMAPDRTQAMKLLMRGSLQHGCTIFQGRVSRASVLIVNPLRPEWLLLWAHNVMPEQSIHQMRFYIGNDAKMKQGVAGKAFKTRSTCVIHISQDTDGQWRADDPDYEFHSKPMPPPYRSFIAVPMLAGDECLGVVCFDSMDEEIFDPPRIRQVVEAQAKRMAVCMQIYEQLVKTSTPSMVPTSKPAKSRRKRRQ